LAAAGYCSTVKIWSVLNPSAPRTDLPVPFSPRALAFAPSNSQLVATGGNGTFSVWELGASARVAQPSRTLRWDGGNGRAVIFARREALLVTASEDGAVQFWDPARLGGYETIASLPPHLNALAMFSDNRAAVSYSWDPVARIGKVCLQDLENRCVERTIAISPGTHAVAASPDGRCVAAACGDNKTRVWEVRSGRQILALDHGSHVQALTFSPTSAMLATAGATTSRDGTTRLWELASGTPNGTCASQAGQSRCVAFAWDGRTLAVGSFDHVFAVDLWDPMTSTRRGRLVDPNSGTPGFQPAGERIRSVAAVAFSPDDATLAAGCSDGVIRQWDVASGDLCQTFSSHVGDIRRLAFTPDGRTLASLGEDNVVNLWHLSTGQRFFSLDTQKQDLRDLAFSRDGRLLIAGARPNGKDGPSALLVWRADSGGP
jgi:WD40 repeat protein